MDTVVGRQEDYGRAIVVTSLATLLVTLIALYLALQRKRLPSGPFAWPVVGNFPSLSGGLPHRVLQTLAKQYGGLMYLRLGSVPTIVVSTVAVSKELFQTQDATFLDRPKLMAMRIITDDCKNLVVASGPHWRRLRKFCASELFTPKRLATYKGARDEEIQMMMKEIVGDSKEGRLINLKSWLQGVTSNSMTRMLLNKRYFGVGGVNKKEKEDYELLIARTFEVAGAFIISDFVPYLAFITILQGWKKRLQDVSDFNTEIAGKVFELEKHRQRAKERANDENYVPDFVDLLLRTPLDDGKILPDKQLTLVGMDMLAAGTETSATAVEWAMAELMTRPEIVQRAQAELNAVVGNERIVQQSDIPNLPFLQAIVKESFRLHPPLAINLPRESSRAFEFRGYKLPKKTRLILNFFAIHRDPSVYEDPDEFKPDRFLERPEVNALNGFDFYELTPFSAGRRMCPAYDLGNTMVSLVLASLLHSFNWALPQGDLCADSSPVDMSELFGLTVSMKTPLRLVANPRPPASLY